MSRLRIIVGPEAMLVERGGVKSSEAQLTDKDTPETVREIANRLWESIRREVSYRAWVGHRIAMAFQRAFTRVAIAHFGDVTFYAGPRDDLIAIKPWHDAVYREWASVPHGVAARLLRGSQ